jgi:mono/diheme cytochrome c family protein
MFRTVISFASISLLAFVRHAQATEPAAITVVPFAVPVAVPVAVVQQPTLFYAYGRYAPAATSGSAPAVAAPSVAAPRSTEADDVRQVALLFARRCAECHQGPTARGDLRLLADDGALITPLPRRAIAEACAPTDGVTPTMPPAGREPLTPAEQALVQRWARPPRTLRY